MKKMKKLKINLNNENFITLKQRMLKTVKNMYYDRKMQEIIKKTIETVTWKNFYFISF